MVTVAEIILWGNPAGAAIWNAENGSAVFEYNSNFLKTGLDPAPLMMPVRSEEKIFSFSTLNYDTYAGLGFRATKDLDIVLLMKSGNLSAGFARELHAFIKAGNDLRAAGRGRFYA